MTSFFHKTGKGITYSTILYILHYTILTAEMQAVYCTMTTRTKVIREFESTQPQICPKRIKTNYLSFEPEHWKLPGYIKDWVHGLIEISEVEDSLASFLKLNQGYPLMTTLESLPS